MMGTKTQYSSGGPFSRFSRLGKSLHPHSPSPRLQGDDDYIPYTGPYEEPPRRRKERDSWGNPLNGDNEDDDLFYAGRELQKRYGGHDRDSTGWNHDDDRADERRSRPRVRTQSGVSGRTVSSGTVDPARVSISTMPRNSVHVPSGARPSVASYINLDAAGGVGESPVPTYRTSKDGGATKRSSLASIFTFGVPNRRSTLFPTKVFSEDTNNTPPLKIKTRPTQPPVTERTSVGAGSQNVASKRVDVGRADAARGSGEEDYYHSYYSTLIPPPTQGQTLRRFASASSLYAESTAKSTSISHHPYAYVFPITEVPETPSSAPVAPTPKLTFDDAAPNFLNPNPSRVATGRSNEPFSELGAQLKSSISTPNLRAATSQVSQPSKAPALPKGKDRWLSAETWCDALLFPRPRLKIKQDKQTLYTGSGRIVSPPGSPITPNSIQNPVEGVVSRVLAHSRSLVDLNNPEPSNDQSCLTNDVKVIPPSLPPPPRKKVANPRPKSFAWDDLALLSPVPSLARYVDIDSICLLSDMLAT